MYRTRGEHANHYATGAVDRYSTDIIWSIYFDTTKSYLPHSCKQNLKAQNDRTYEIQYLQFEIRNSISKGYIAAVIFIGGGNRSTRKKPPTGRKSLTNLITKWCIEYTSPLAEFELQTLVVIGTDFTGSCKSNTITSTNKTDRHDIT